MTAIQLPTKAKKWTVKKKRFVACLDLLGFKNLVMRKPHNEIFNLLSSFSHHKKYFINYPKDGMISNVHPDVEVSIVSFSDSIFIFSKGDDISNFEYFIIAVRYLFYECLELGIPLKGGIAHGEISLDQEDSIYFGQPIIDAHLLQEDLKYLGVVADCSIDAYIESLKTRYQKSRHLKRLFFEEKTPFKWGSVTHKNINWFNFHPGVEELRKNGNAVIEFLNRLKVGTSGEPRKYVDNTLELLKTAMERDANLLFPLERVQRRS